jgi:hypothetical protein
MWSERLSVGLAGLVLCSCLTFCCQPPCAAAHNGAHSTHDLLTSCPVLDAVSGHGVPQPVINSALQAMQQLFALPHASKAAMAHNSHAKGYMPWGQQTLDLAAQRCGDTKETWAVMGETSGWSWVDNARPGGGGGRVHSAHSVVCCVCAATTCICA